MFRSIMCFVMMLGVCAGCNNKTVSKTREGTLTKVNSKTATVAVKMQGDGKEVEKTFKLAENVEYMDSTGRMAVADIFTSGDMVLIVESEGTISKMQKTNKADVAKQPDSTDKTLNDSKSDKTFIQAADQINLAEMKLGKIAEQHAANDAVKKFGARAVHDHLQMNDELRDITNKKGIELAEVLDHKHQGLLDGLVKMKGADFDRAYTKDMVAGHEKAIEKFENEAKNGQDSEVKAWAKKWLPTLREHLTLARETVKDVNGS